jgi:hypothetical protein
LPGPATADEVVPVRHPGDVAVGADDDLAQHALVGLGVEPDEVGRRRVAVVVALVPRRTG